MIKPNWMPLSWGLARGGPVNWKLASLMCQVLKKQQKELMIRLKGLSTKIVAI